MLPVREIRISGLPAITDAGDKEVKDGKGLFTVKASVPEVPPPGAGVVIDTEGIPA